MLICHAVSRQLHRLSTRRISHFFRFEIRDSVLSSLLALSCDAILSRTSVVQPLADDSLPSRVVSSSKVSPFITATVTHESLSSSSFYLLSVGCSLVGCQEALPIILGSSSRCSFFQFGAKVLLFSIPSHVLWKPLRQHYYLFVQPLIVPRLAIGICSDFSFCHSTLLLLLQHTP